MKLLALDASTEACSVALMIDGEVTEQYEIVPRQHTQRILPMVDALLADAGLSLKQLDLLACDRGPGSFTGVRISTSVVQGLAFAADLPVIPVSSLAALAQAAYADYQQQSVIAVIDARMQEIYWGQYQCHEGVMQLHGSEQVSEVATLLQQTQGNWLLTGSGVQAYRELLTNATQFTLVDKLHYPRAREIALLAETMPQLAVTAEKLQPVYLRDNVAVKVSN